MRSSSSTPIGRRWTAPTGRARARGTATPAARPGLVPLHGDANRADVLRLAGAQHATAIVVATNSDPTAVLVTLTARELAPKAKIIAPIRESANQHLLRQSGGRSA